MGNIVEKTIIDKGDFSNYLLENFDKIVYLDKVENYQDIDTMLTYLANDLLWYTKTFYTTNFEQDREYLIKFLSMNIYNKKDFQHLLYLRLLFNLKEAEIKSFINFILTFYYQHGVLKKTPSIRIEKNIGQNSLGASYDIINNAISFYCLNKFPHLSSLFLKKNLIHELGHFLYTIETDIHNRERLKFYVQNLSKPYGMFLNLMEDIRIDCLLMQKFFIAKEIYVDCMSNLKSLDNIQKKNMLLIEKLDKSQRKQFLFRHLNSILKFYTYLPNSKLEDYIETSCLSDDEKAFVDKYFQTVEKVKNAKTFDDVIQIVEQFYREEFPLDYQNSEENEEESEEICQGKSEQRNEQNGKGEGEQNGECGFDQNEETDLSQILKKFIETNQQESENKEEIIDIVEQVNQQMEQILSKEFLKTVNNLDIRDRVDQHEVSYGNPFRVDISSLTKEYRLFFSQKLLNEQQIPVKLLMSYFKGISDAEKIIFIKNKQKNIYTRNGQLDYKRYMYLELKKEVNSSGISNSDFNLFKKKVPINISPIGIDCVVDTSGSMSIWGENANQTLAYIMGLHDGIKHLNVFNLNLYLIRIEEGKNLCINLSEFLKKRFKQKGKFSISSLRVINSILYTASAEGLTSYLENVYPKKTSNDYIFFITDAHFCNTKDWELIENIKNKNKQTRPKLIGLYVNTNQGDIHGVESYLKKAFDEYHIFSLNNLSKTCIKLVNQVLEANRFCRNKNTAN